MGSNDQALHKFAEFNLRNPANRFDNSPLRRYKGGTTTPVEEMIEFIFRGVSFPSMVSSYVHLIPH